jgi:hypothetical protein
MNEGLGNHDEAARPEASQVERRRLVLEGPW